MLHKPFDQRTLKLLGNFHENLEENNTKSYRLYENMLDKGITNKLISSAKIVIWDQLGTGALQCFTAGIPTMILWKRIYSQESIEAKDLINDLEKNGVIHSSEESLIIELQKFLNEPFKWNNYTNRKNAIHSFCNNFAMTNQNWDKIWKNKLSYYLNNDFTL